MKLKSELVNDDWERIYIDNELVYEGHSAPMRQVMYAIDGTKGFVCEYTAVTEED